MTTVLEVPARAPDDGADRPPFPVRIEESALPAHDPLALYAALRERLGQDEVFLLESLDGARRDRSSAVVGCGRLAEIRAYADRVELSGVAPVVRALTAAGEELGLVRTPDGLSLTEDGELWDLLRAAQALFAVETERPVDAYAFGFLAALGYGAAWHMEQLPPRGPAQTAAPDCVLTLFRDTVWYDLGDGSVRRLHAEADVFAQAGQAGQAGHAGQPAPDLAALVEALAPLPEEPPAAPAPRGMRDSTDRETFLGQVDRCLEHIGVGDIYQIQIGHRIDVTTDLAPLDVYRRLRTRNPSPYMYLAPHDGGTLIGASPEVLFRTEGDRIVMRPIAGTTPRTGDTEEDGRRVQALLASEKEQAEHVMLVDLCRNDIGRVCRPGTLVAEELMTVEAFSHVFHLVSTVEGRLDPTADTWAALRATFPAGTVTGAPKIRAMEIIAGLESEPRGMYAGGVGLLDARGWSQFALCIRTVVHKDGVYSTQSCAGIVADSEPALEWRETLAKMGAAHWALTGEELLP